MIFDFLLKRQEYNRAKNEMKNLPISSFSDFEPQGYMGLTSKSFVNIEGSYIVDMYDDIYNSPDKVYYKTCMDDAFNDKSLTRDEFCRMKVSCIVKKFDNTTRGIRYASAELCGSRIANIFGVNTNYVAPIKYNPDKVIVIDCLSGNQEFDDFYDLTGYAQLDVYNLPKGEFAIRRLLQRITRTAERKIPDGPHKEQLIYNLQRDFIKFYLLRRYVLMDGDLVPQNMIFLHEKDGDFTNLRMGPAIDFENCFTVENAFITSSLEEEMRFLVNRYPNQLSDVIKAFTFSDKKDRIKAVFDKFDKGRVSTKERINCIENMLININGYYNMYTQQSPQNTI